MADLNRSLEYWVGRMGAETLTRWESYALLRIGEGRLHLATMGEPPPDRAVRLVPPPGSGDVASSEVVLRVGDCEAVVAELESRGVDFLGPPARPAWGGEVRAFASDPDGHLVEITSAA